MLAVPAMNVEALAKLVVTRATWYAKYQEGMEQLLSMKQWRVFR